MDMNEREQALHTALERLRKAVVGLVWEQLEGSGDGSDFFVCQLCGARTRDYKNPPHKANCPMTIAKLVLERT